MKYLLDTHTAIWALGDKARLSGNAKTIIDDVSLPLCISMVNAWEVAIKVSIGKLDFAGGASFFLKRMEYNGIEIMDMERKHLEIVEKLPFIHRDPFDRLLIATVLSEGLTIVTADENIQKYDVPWIW